MHRVKEIEITHQSFFKWPRLNCSARACTFEWKKVLKNAWNNCDTALQICLAKIEK